MKTIVLVGFVWLAIIALIAGGIYGLNRRPKVPKPSDDEPQEAA